MAQSLVKLTLESNEYEKKLRNAQKAWGDFTKGIGLSVGKFTAVGAAIGAVTGALKVAKDAFFNNEQQLDEWGRTVDASKSLYNGFLNALNNGDISGYLQNMNTITEAARAAYDAMDELGTFNAFNQINTQKARTGYAEALAGFRLGDTSKEDAMKAAETYKKELKDRREREQEAYSQAVRKLAAERGVPWGNLEQALSGTYGDYKKLKEIQPTGKRIVYHSNGQFGGTTSYEVPVAVTAQEKMGEALRKLNDTELQNLQALGAQAQRTGEEIAQIDKQLARVVNAKDKTSTTGTTKGIGSKVNKTTKVEQTELQQNQKQINTLTQEYVKLGDDATESARQRQIEIQKEIALLKERNGLLNLRAEQAQGKFTKPLTQEEIGGMVEDAKKGVTFADKSYLDVGIGIDPDKLETLNELKQDGDDAAKSWQKAQSAISAVGTAMQGIEDPTAKVLGYIAQAIAAVAAGAGQAVSAKDVTASGWGWIAAAAAITASMVAMITTIHSATGYAQGGVIPGNSYSGDNQWARVNAGETILTRAQAANISTMLANGGLNNMKLEAYADGRTLKIVMNEDSQSRGRGRLVTSNKIN